MNDREARIVELERQIEELRKRFPAHSIPPGLMAELDELEEELEELLKASDQ
ncbi:MAG: histidine kinase [Anaerolineales bacterium]